MDDQARTYRGKEMLRSLQVMVRNYIITGKRVIRQILFVFVNLIYIVLIKVGMLYRENYH